MVDSKIAKYTCFNLNFFVKLLIFNFNTAFKFSLSVKTPDSDKNIS